MAASSSFARIISQWGQQKAHEAHQKETLAFAGYLRGTLRVEGISLQNGGVSILHRMLQSHGMCAAVRKLEIVRCSLGGSFVENNVSATTTSTSTEAAVAESETLQALQSLIQSLPHLKSIDLSCNFLENAAVQLIVEGLSKNQGLEEIILEDNRLKGRLGGRLIRSILEQHPKLTSLNIYENAIAAEGAVEMIPALSHHGKLIELNIACCEIHDETTQEKTSIYQVLVDSFLQNPHLKELQWTVGHIDGDYEITAQTSPCQSGTLAIARLLENHPGLESLSIIQSPDFWSPDQPQDVNERFARALGNNRTVQRLTLEGCGISDDSVAALCDALMQNPVLQHLDLLSNDLGDEGLEHFHRVIPKLKHLRSLSIEGSTLEKPEDFVAAMEKNTSLTYVRVLDIPRVDIAPALDQFALRNELMIHSQEMLDISLSLPEAVSDAIWGQTLARLALEAQGISALYEIISRKLWVPQELQQQQQQQQQHEMTQPPLRKRQRLDH
mmetsp:Transcript_25252/g.47934  ORF Transcript_25252/g.47934 Transcript_25252/m.47934 type:complete len:499 (+) Transcript_25252:155-1651(+)